MGGGKRRPDCKDCRNSRSKYAYVRDRPRIRNRQKRWYATHREEHGKRVLAARAKREDAYREQQRLYRQQPETQLLLRENQSRRRAQPASYRDGRRVGGFYKKVLERDGMVCHICAEMISTLADLHFDHVTPFSRGGEHTFENVKPSHARCNRRKAARLRWDERKRPPEGGL